MNIFMIHSGKDREKAKIIKKDLKEKCNKANVLLLDYRAIWRPEAKKLMKAAQIVLYIVGEDSYKSRHINWEIKKALKLKKSIVVYKMDKTYNLNSVLKSKDPFTMEEIYLADEVNSVDELIDIVVKYENGEHITLINENVNDMSLLEQYKLFSDTSEALVNRRQSVNSFYITANTALLTIAATAFSLNGDFVSKLIIMIVLTIPGILLNFSWIRILEAYGIINSSKMKILGMLEKRLSVSLYDAEWQDMSNKYNKRHYVSFTDSEKNLPKIFNIVYFLIDVICGVVLYVLISPYINFWGWIL